MKIQLSSAFQALSLFLTVINCQILPYNPTTILLPSGASQPQDIAYIFLQNTESDLSNQLASLNISSVLSASNITLEVITSALPFQTDGSAAFLPSISSSGDICVYSGSCSTSTSAQLWSFTPSINSSLNGGAWMQRDTTTASDVTSADLPGANFLSRSFSFSTLVHASSSQTQVYVLGGMCPNSGATTSTWQSAASYSNNMLKLSPMASSIYSLDVPSSRGPPIAEAGFTMTGLTPTYSNGSVLTQQQNFVLLGGHTQSAFINMSQVAIWSLPEEVWSFVSVDSPASSNANTELTVKNVVTSVDSRSGHTAVLTEDGSKIVVFGGWVGDTSQAAEPQLAMLDVGAGFGGAGDWSWTIPTQQPSGTGIYGHGAAILPGNVMMVMGGYNISSVGNSKRDTLQVTMPATNAMFFNMTSLTWSTDYTNPAYTASEAAATSAFHASTNKSDQKKLGLGLGLGLGFGVILIAAIILYWYSRRLRLRRVEERDNYIQSLSAGQASFYSPTAEMGQRSGGFPWANNGWNRNSSNQEIIHDSTSAVAGYENLHAGIHGLGDNGIPPVPRQVQRKPLYSRNAKGLYQPTSTSDPGSHGRSNSLGTAGPIHPIYEADEDDHMTHDPNDSVGVGVEIAEPSSENLQRHPDPFRDPPINFSAPLRHEGRNSPDSESPARSREREIQEWVSDWAAADALLTTQAKSHSSAGRISPTRRAQLIAASNVSSVSGDEGSGRTESNLSERSIAISVMSVSRSGSSSQGRSRSNSLRGFITNAMNPFASALLSTTVGSSTMSPVFDGSAKGQPPRSAGSGTTRTNSFTTANSSFPALQAEGENLLPRPEDGFESGENSPTRSIQEPGSPSKSKPSAIAKGRSSWLGNIRKALVGETASGEASPEVSTFGNRTSSPVRAREVATEPRRTVSAGAMLWRRKQGRGDWDDSAHLDAGAATSQRSNTFTGDLHSLAPRGVSEDLDDDDDWDIERAVQNRVVQVMFTVPKEKLRVVNHDFDEDKSEVGSLRSKKGSNKSIRLVQPMESLEETLPDIEKELEVKDKGKGKGKVLELVEKLEARTGSPER